MRTVDTLRREPSGLWEQQPDGSWRHIDQPGSVGGSLTGWTDLPLGANVTSYGSPYGTPQYRLMPDGTVRLRGLIKATAGITALTSLATLPVGCRPGVTQAFFTTWTPNTGIRVDVDANGALFSYTALALNDWITLSPISFIAER